MGTATRRATAWIAIALAVATLASAAPGTVPQGVSPGTLQDTVIGDSCPTFSWAAIEGASAYELVVYRVGGDVGRDDGELGDVTGPMLAERIPGAAQSWSPPLERCFERGVPLAWSVRAQLEGGASDWATPLFFTVAEPSPAELAAALELVRHYFAADGGRDLAGAPAEKSAPPRALERSSEIGTSAARASDLAPGPLVRQASPGSVGATAAKMTVVGEVRTVDAGGEPRLWGRGRPNIGIYPKPISPGTHYCHNPDTTVTFGLSTAMVDWASAADACPAGTWVCGASDINGCDTARPDEEHDSLECDGTPVSLASFVDGGWLDSVGPTGEDARGLFQYENGSAIRRLTCESWPVWCCWE